MTWFVDAALAVVVLEACVLIALGGRIGRGISPRNVVSGLLPGAALMLALRFAMTNGGARAIAITLCLAFVAHLHDLYRRTVATG